MRRSIWLILSLMILFLVMTVSVYFKLSANSQVLANNLISKIIQITFFFTIGSVIFIVIRENSSPVNTLAWIQVLIFLPVFGFILYIFLGINYRKRKIFSRKETDDCLHISELISTYKVISNSKEEIKSIPLNPQQRMMHLLYSNNKALLTKFNEIKLYHTGKDTISAIFQELQKAKKHIHLEYFAVANDSIGKKLFSLLRKKSDEGVKIRIIIDAVGSWLVSSRMIEQLKEHKIEIYYFLPVIFPFISSKLNFRNHRKLIIIDGKIGFIGGVNFGKKYYGESKYFGLWRDTHLKLEGESVYALQKTFLLDWKFVSKTKVTDESFFPKNEITNKLSIQIVNSGPDSDWKNILQAYFSAITTAQRFIYIASPYLVLDESICMALITAALSGIDIRIILPSKPDHRIVFYGSRSYYEELLKAGVRIFEYQLGFIHSKVILVDDHFASIGTANMDVRSMKQNFEVNAIIYDKKTIQKVRDEFFNDFSNSKEINLEEFQKRKLWIKMTESFSRLFSPVL